MKKWQRVEAVGGDFALALMFRLVKILPHALSVAIAVPVSVVYFITARKARKAIRGYLDKAEKATGRKLSTWKSFLAFSITLIEKIEGWAGKMNYSHLHSKTSGVEKFNATLKSGKGVILITAHLGSAEELRALSTDFSEIELGRKAPILSVVDFDGTAKFNSMLKKLNPDSMQNLLSINSMTIADIEKIQETLADNGIVVIAGDRSGSRNIDAEFLGEPAPFPFGAFYLPALLAAPSFFGVCVRSADISFKKSYEIYVEENRATPAQGNKAGRRMFAEASCKNFAAFLEKNTLKHPYQWYNFYDFWRK